MIITLYILTVLMLASWGFGVLEIIGMMFLLHLGASFIGRAYAAYCIHRLQP